MANVIIDIAAEFTGKKGFKQAETATDKMSKNVKKLAGALGLAFSGQQILAFGKASIKAAAEDEKAQKQLALALKNVGLGRDAASSEDYIQRLQSEFGIVDDKLRPAYQTLAVATRNSSEAQRLLNLSLDISASTGRDLSSVTAALSRAYLGNNTALGKLGVGISKADLKAGKFEDIVSQLETTFAGSATAAANTFQGSIDKLGVASANVQEIIGTGLIDALKGISDDGSVDNLAAQMESVATYTADVIRGIGVMIGYIKTASEAINKIPGLNKIMDLVLRTNPLYEPIVLLNKLGKEAAAIAAQTGDTAQALAHLAELEAKYSTNALGVKRKLTAEELKALAAAKKKLLAKKLEAAIDKANLALNKGQEIFDMDKIQIAAALTNQAEQLGKATSSAQVLQIANDTARLNVKRSILALEDAIAAKDEAAIVAATAKLNADLKVLGALGMQNVKLQDIKSILESLKPKDLINISNLEEALRLLAEINLLSKAKVPTSASLGSGIPAGDYIAPISTAGGSIGAILEYAEAATARANAFADLLDMENASAASQMASTIDLESIARSSLLQGLSGGAGVSGAVSGSRYAAQAANAYNITIQAGIGDPEAIARAVEDVVRQSYQRGTSATGLLAV
jgi:hypothetical protein